MAPPASWSTILLNIVVVALAMFLPLGRDGVGVAATQVLADDYSSTRLVEFHVKYTEFTRLCYTKCIVTVNDEFPGPTLYVREGESVQVSVINELPDKNITIHWHGIHQVLSGWFDGPAYITQCPIQPGASYLYNFRVTGQRGTLFWHAHLSWMRSTVHGAIIILPKAEHGYPFAQPAGEIPIVLGDWWISDTEAVINQALASGAAPNVSDAYTINGQPGTLYDCSAEDVFTLPALRQKKTYLLRIINACLNDELFLSVANHTLTVVEIDATYTKPFKTSTILISPGQTTNVLLTADQPTGRYLLAVRAYNPVGDTVPFDNSTATAMLQYVGSSSASEAVLPDLPPYDDTMLAINFSSSLRSLNSKEFPASVPIKVDRHLLFTVGLARNPCPPKETCHGPSGGKLSATVSNISFSLPTTALLQSFFFQSIFLNTASTMNVFHTNFPDNPVMPFNYTGPQPKNLAPEIGTRLSRLLFNSTVQLILQGTSIVRAGSHPMHLHGFSFYVVGQGLGNFNSYTDPASFNLVDPPERNTVGVPKGGWTAIRFRADNPGVWFMHCHLEAHTSWGMETVFLVSNGIGPQQSLQPPPSDLPSC